MSPRRSQQGFSLIELIVVMSIITVLAGAALPVLTKSISRARVQDTRVELGRLQGAMNAYFEDTGIFPPKFDDLEKNLSKTPGWVGPYLTSLTASSVGQEMSLSKDAWDQDYAVKLSKGIELTITSMGLDGKLKTTDDLVVVIDVTPILRRQTLDELALLNAAVLAYNAVSLPDTPLSNTYTALLSTLQSGGYLPSNTDRFDEDAWGDVYQPDPQNGVPVVALTSKNLSESS